MKHEKFLIKLAGALELIAIYILIFNATKLIVTLADWFKFMAVFSALLIDLLYNKMEQI